MNPRPTRVGTLIPVTIVYRDRRVIIGRLSAMTIARAMLRPDVVEVDTRA